MYKIQTIIQIIFLYLAIEDILYKEISYLLVCVYLLLNAHDIFTYILFLCGVLCGFIPPNIYFGHIDLVLLLLEVYNFNSIFYIYILTFMYSLYFKQIPFVSILYLNHIINTCLLHVYV